MLSELGEAIHPGLTHVGELVVADIGIITARGPKSRRKSTCSIKKPLAGWCRGARRTRQKGTHGHLLVVAGAEERPARRFYPAAPRCGPAQDR